MNSLAYKDDSSYDMTQPLSDDKNDSENFSISGKKELFKDKEPQKMKSDSTSGGGPHVSEWQADERKRYHRAVSAKIPLEEKKRLIKERNRLVDKKFNTEDGLSKIEAKKLTLIRWKLDRIEDAEYGEELDRLSAFVAVQEQYSRDLREFIDEVYQ